MTFCIAFIVGYTILNVCLNYLVQIELNPTLTTCVYSFFGAELGLCTFNRLLDVMRDGKSSKKSSKKKKTAPTPEEVDAGIGG